MRRTMIVCIWSMLLALPVSDLCAFEKEPMTKTDYILEGIWIGLQIADLKTTQDGASKHDEGYKELNPILGIHPSHSELNVWFATCAVGHGFVTYMLPQPYRRWWQIVWIGLTAQCVYNNYRIGLRMEF